MDAYLQAKPDALAVAAFQLSQHLLRHLVVDGRITRDEALTIVESAAEDAEASGDGVGMTAGVLIRQLLDLRPLDGRPPA